MPAVGTDVERQARIERHDGRYLPAAQHRRSNTGIQPPLARTEGQGIDQALLEVEPVVVIVGGIVVALINPEVKTAVVAGLVAQTLAPGK